MVIEVPPDPTRYDRVVRSVNARTFLWMRIGAAVVVLLGVWLLFASAVTYGVGLVCAGGALLFAPLLAKRSNRDIAARVNGPSTVVLADSGVTTIEPGMRGDVSWERFGEARETASEFILHLARIQVVIVPKQLMAPGQDAVLRAFLQQRQQLV
ncbi:YcxB family protein [Pseudonocardia sp. TRM90224]|uniref:YcxB family protein n=1 Tax=Pseudonocardia sp. TRM90224 TaxID=2812678 RepID=UPI001E5B07DA|nr:YcxB family protein [Pseudonocardia sp. TRM90224]